MFTTHKNRIIAALSLSVLLAGSTLLADDNFGETMREAAARNDTQILPDNYVGGATFAATDHSRWSGGQEPGAYRYTMRDAAARNDSQLLPEGYSGGATFVRNGGGNGAGDSTAFVSTMRDAFERHDSQLLPEAYSGGPSFDRPRG